MLLISTLGNVQRTVWRIYAHWFCSVNDTKHVFTLKFECITEFSINSFRYVKDLFAGKFWWHFCFKLSMKIHEVISDYTVHKPLISCKNTNCSESKWKINYSIYVDFLFKMLYSHVRFNMLQEFLLAEFIYFICYCWYISSIAMHWPPC